jgi:hypothetical protein
MKLGSSSRFFDRVMFYTAAERARGASETSFYGSPRA